MPVTTDTLWNMRRLNVVFGVSAVLMLVSFFWMMKHDMDRKWRDFQVQYFNARSGLAHLTYLAYGSPGNQEKHKALQDAVDKARASVDSNAVAKLEAEIQTKAGELEGVALDYGNTNAALGVTVFYLDESQAFEGMKDDHTESLKDKYEAQVSKLAGLKKTKDSLEDDLRRLKASLKQLQAPVASAERELSAFEKGFRDAHQADIKFGPSITRALLNAPILDFAPPHDIPGRQEVKNLFMKNIRTDLNFTDTYVSDRCTTCHIGIDNPEFTQENLVAQAEEAIQSETVRPVLERENEKLAKELDRRLVDVDTSLAGGDKAAFINLFISAANKFLEETDRPHLYSKPIHEAFANSDPDRGTVQSAIDKQFQRIVAAEKPRAGADREGRPLTWREMDENERDNYFLRLMAAVNLYMENNDDASRPAIKYGKVIAAHPRLDLFISATSAHPMKSMGCTVCHEGSGQETDFIFAAHTPKDTKQRHEWEHEYGERELGIPMNSFHTVDEFWERPMLKDKYTSASCAKCHDQIFDLDRHKTAPLPEAANIVEGRELFTRVGCINCHNVDGLSDSRRVGTDLTHVSSKLTPGFMERWIEYPNNFRPSTRMPHFFKQENNVDSSGRTETGYSEFDPQPELRTETEIQAIAHYLNVFSKPWEPLPSPEGIEADPKRGEELFVSIGCLACHVNLDAHDPLDDEHRTFGEKWIVKDIAVEKARLEAQRVKRTDGPPDGDAIQAMIDAEMPAAKEAFDAMSKNDRVRYASRRFSRRARQHAMLAAKTERFEAETQDNRTPDPLLTYVPPEFTKQGPELSGLGTKLVPDASDENQQAHGTRWLYNWLRDPRHYSSYTVMPRMFRDHYYQQDTAEEQQLKNDQDILDVTAYLLSLRNDDFDMTRIADDDTHRDMREHLLREILGGLNTKSVVDIYLADEKNDGETYGPLTSAIVSQATASFGGGDEGRQHVEALIEAKSNSLEDRRKLFLGMKMISHYGCYSCHTISGFEDATRPGTDLSTWAQKFMSQLDFAYYSPVFEHEREERPEMFENTYRGDLPDNAHLIRDVAEASADLLAHIGGKESDAGNFPQSIHHNHASFAYYKIRNPRIWDRGKIRKPYEKIKMPNFFFTEEEATAITTYVLSRRDANVREPVKIDYEDTSVGRIARGRALANQLNCYGCHTIEADVPATIHQYYTEDPSVDDSFVFGPRFKPPLLWGEGAKIQNDWLFKFFNNVEMLRPWLHARMPSFYLSTEDATQLVEYFAGLTQYESKVLDDELLPVAKYLQQVHSGASVGDNPTWYMSDRFDDESEFLRDYALRHNQARVYDFDDSAAENAQEREEALSRGFEIARTRAEFLMGVFNVPFPFTDPRTHRADDARFKLGEEFFYDQRCLACHVAGDPSVPGTTTDIKAPNFALASKRLRYDWVINWLQNPQAIQPGANMPQIFQDGGSAYSLLSGEDRTSKEEKFGSEMDVQAHLLVDFLFELGNRNYTAIQPGALDQPAGGGAAGEGDEIDFGGGDDKAEEVEVDF
ncbi:MAG: c-type cytochrome [Phycisphaerales bacterium]|nr:c-type cytochrome [Phycisphaerales bacterium]MCB9854264.1 c-type cytochrome [Phycisphaerales bacterium]